MSKTKTYREELEAMCITEENGETIVPNFVLSMYKFMFWIVSKTNKQSGYIDNLSKNNDNSNCIDIMKVTLKVIDDNIIEIVVKEEYKKKITELKEYFELILSHLNDTVRINFRVLYPEDRDDENPKLKCDMLSECNALMNDILSSNLLEEKKEN